MGNRKKMIIWGGAGLVLIAVAALGFSLIHTNKGNVSNELDKVDMEGDLGIHYGGNFDEATGTYRDGYVPDTAEQRADADIDEAEKDVVNETPEEKLKKFDEAGEGDIYGEEDSKDRIVLYDNNSVEDSEVPDAVDINEIVKNVEDFDYEADGYDEHELICDAESLEKAESIASQISGTVLSWNEGVATIRIDGSVDELLERLEQEGSNLMLYRKYDLKKK